MLGDVKNYVWPYVHNIGLHTIFLPGDLSKKKEN